MTPDRGSCLRPDMFCCCDAREAPPSEEALKPLQCGLGAADSLKSLVVKDEDEPDKVSTSCCYILMRETSREV